MKIKTANRFSAPVARLINILSYMRPHDSVAEKEMIDRFITPYKPVVYEGALVVQVAGDNDTLFSCHTDTVHTSGGKQRLNYDVLKNELFKTDKEPLGADNGAGVWLLLEMIDAGVPGWYAFHHGEERGCIGSRWMADHCEGFLKDFKRAVAFDRRGIDSVITRQRGQECCSPVFAQALADELNKCGLDFMYSPDPTGLITDTAQYTHLIPECTNVSVGYANEHGPSETLNVAHLQRLRDAVVKMAWSTLPTERICVPKWTAPKFTGYSWPDHGSGDLQWFKNKKRKQDRKDELFAKLQDFYKKQQDANGYSLLELMSMDMSELEQWVWCNSETAAIVLFDLMHDGVGPEGSEDPKIAMANAQLSALEDVANDEPPKAKLLQVVPSMSTTHQHTAIKGAPGSDVFTFNSVTRTYERNDRFAG